MLSRAGKLAAAVVILAAAIPPSEMEASVCIGKVSLCIDGCPNTPQMFCEGIRPGCEYESHTCTWWNLECWGVEDEEIECKYKNGEV